jgi:hypothetical protein
LRIERPYEHLDITGVKGLTEAQKLTLCALGAIDRMAARQPETSHRTSAITTAAHSVASTTPTLGELDIEWAIGFALHTLAQGAYYTGDLTRALALIRESVVLFRGLKPEGSLAEVLITLGIIVRAQGDRAAAYTAIAEAPQFAWAVGSRLMVASALEGVASVVVTQGHAEQAARLLAIATVLRGQMGTPVRPADQAAVEQALATARSTLGDDAFVAVWEEAQAMPLDHILKTIPGASVLAVLRDRAVS